MNQKALLVHLGIPGVNCADDILNILYFDYSFASQHDNACSLIVKNCAHLVNCDSQWYSAVIWNSQPDSISLRYAA